MKFMKLDRDKLERNEDWEKLDHLRADCIIIVSFSNCCPTGRISFAPEAHELAVDIIFRLLDHDVQL